MPKVSIIVPIYNNENTLQKCLDSLLAQTHNDIEIVCMNDGSTDRSAQIIDKYSAMDNRICVIHKENEGVSKTRNAAISIASGEYIMFVDGDDYIAPNMVENLYNALSCKDDIAICGYTEINALGSFEICDYTGCKSKEDFILHCIKNTGGVVCGKLYRSKLIKETSLAFDENLTQSEDLIFALNAFIKAAGITQIKYCGYFYDRRNESRRKVTPTEWLEKSLSLHELICKILAPVKIQTKESALNERLERIIHLGLYMSAEEKQKNIFISQFKILKEEMKNLSFSNTDILNRLWLKMYKSQHFHLAYFICRLRITLSRLKRT